MALSDLSIKGIFVADKINQKSTEHKKVKFNLCFFANTLKYFVKKMYFVFFFHIKFKDRSELFFLL